MRLALGAIWMMGCLAAVPLLAQSQGGGFQPEPWMGAAPTSTGPAVGEKIPSFRALDQNRRWQDFNSIRGPKGAVIMFNRSADW